MSYQANPRLLTLASLTHRCSRETDHFFQRQPYDPEYCFELFRRAIVEHNQRAWEFLYDQYRPLVVGWVERHSAFPTSGEEAQYFVNCAFEKMWGALTPVKFSRFPDLKSLLRYLQMCVHSVIVDWVRTAEGPTVDADVEMLATESTVQSRTVENRALGLVRREEIWQEISARLNSEEERLAVYGSFILGLKPRELQAQFQDVFCDVKEIYRAKENVLARLRRDRELKRLFGGDI